LGYSTGTVAAGTAFGSLTGETTVHSSITPPVGFDTQHTSIIAACLKVVYTGDLDDLSG